jgi:hypothetical protein
MNIRLRMYGRSFSNMMFDALFRKLAMPALTAVVK